MSRCWTRTAKSSPTTPGWCADAASAPRGSSRSRPTDSRQPRSGITRAGAQAKPDRLKSVLAQMDAGSAKFHSAEASIQKQQFEKIVNDTTTESGTIYFHAQRQLHADGQAKIRVLPNAQTLEYKNGMATYVFSPAPTRSMTYSTLGQEPGAGRDCSSRLASAAAEAIWRKAWIITDQGTEQMSDGSQTVDVEKLDLVPRTQACATTTPTSRSGSTRRAILAETGVFHAFGRHAGDATILHQHPPEPKDGPKAVCHQVQGQVQRSAALKRLRLTRALRGPANNAPIQTKKTGKNSSV